MSFADDMIAVPCADFRRIKNVMVVATMDVRYMFVLWVCPSTNTSISDKDKSQEGCIYTSIKYFAGLIMIMTESQIPRILTYNLNELYAPRTVITNDLHTTQPAHYGEVDIFSATYTRFHTE